MASPVWGPNRWGAIMQIYSFTASYDGELVMLDARPTSAGATDFGLPGHTIRMRSSWACGDYGDIWRPVWDLAVDALDRFSLDSRRLSREREQLVLPLDLPRGSLENLRRRLR